MVQLFKVCLKPSVSLAWAVWGGALRYAPLPTVIHLDQSKASPVSLEVEF